MYTAGIHVGRERGRERVRESERERESLVLQSQNINAQMNETDEDKVC